MILDPQRRGLVSFSGPEVLSQREKGWTENRRRGEGGGGGGGEGDRPSKPDNSRPFALTMTTQGEEGAGSLRPTLGPQAGEARGRGQLSVLSESVKTHSMTSSVVYHSTSSSTSSFTSASSSHVQASGSHVQEPVSILGKGRHYSTGSNSSSASPRHTVKFTEPQETMRRERTPESPRWKTQTGQEKHKYQETFKHKLLESASSACASSTHRGLAHGFHSIPETTAAFESSNLRFSESTKLVGTSFRCPDSPRSKTLTRTADRNSIIASMELKVPSFHDLSSSPTGSGLSPLLGPPERRGLTILSPHNPTPELHFSSTFTVRTRKGKTIVLPKLRIPAFHSHSHDSIFLG